MTGGDLNSFPLGPLGAQQASLRTLAHYESSTIPAYTYPRYILLILPGQ